MTTRRTVDSQAGTLKTMSKLTGKSVFAKLFSITAMGLMAVSLMSFIQKDDTAAKNQLVTVAGSAKINEAIECCDSNDEGKVKLENTGFAKVVLSEDFVKSLRNIKLEVSKADREIVKGLYKAEVAKKQAVAFFQKSQAAIQIAEAEVAERMKEEAIKYNFFSGNASVINEAQGEVEGHMQETAVKLAVDASMKMDMLTADDEVAAGLQQKSPETAVANFMKAVSKNITDADAEINNTIQNKSAIATKK
jgi:hypothetical protein